MKGDAFTLEVFRSQVSSIAGEMGAALHHAAYSPNIKERKDHSCAVFDPEGRMVAQAEHIPVHLGAMPEAVRAVLGRFDLGPGDLVVLNDPFVGGTHLPDISMVSPVFAGGDLVGLLASRAHHSDVGGLAPGSLALTVDIFQEGLVIPPVLLQKAGVLNSDIEELICSNSRTPVERAGDLQAQAGAHAVGERRLVDLAARLGRRSLLGRFGDLMDYSEELCRLSLSDLPDGEYRFADVLDDDGLAAENIPISVCVTISGGEAHVDFAGTSPPVEGPLNCPRAVTMSATYYVFRCVTGEDIPANEGAFRPITVSIPEDCLLAARRPHPVGGGNVETSQRVVDTLLGALAGALPGSIPAASYGTMSNLAIGSSPGAAPFSYYETIAGGTGGHPEGLGSSGTHAHMTNTLNTPVEALEYAYPLRVNHYRIRRASGGSGLHRGGDGLDRQIELLDDCSVTILADRRKRGPWGLAGGSPGKPGHDHVITGGRSKRLPSKCNIRAHRGDRVRIITPGGGGWGARRS
jgi:N-methylhydantoinase B